jgi:transcriptional regulator with XRE-family HTH domain
MTSKSRRSGLANALRGWRRRRRVSHLELALRAGSTQRYVSFIEGGRSVPSRAIVIRLAEALEVPLRERNALLLSAGYAPAYAETRFDDPTLGPIRNALERILEGHLPCPAVITDRYGDLISSNSAFWALTEDVAPALLAPPVNVSRLLLHPQGMAPRIINLEHWGWHVIDALHQRTVRNPNARLDALVTELKEFVPDRPREMAPDYRGFAVPLRLRSSDGDLQLLTTLTHFGTAIDVTVAELTLEAFLPADEATAAILPNLAASPRNRQPSPLTGATGSPQLSSDSGCGPQSGAKPLELMTWAPDPSAFMTRTFNGWPGMNWLNTILVPSGE